MKALVLSSGGVDSTTCLGLAIERFGKENVIALAITYGQKHTKEVEAAQAVAQYYGIELLSLDLSTIFRYDTNTLTCLYINVRIWLTSCHHISTDKLPKIMGNSGVRKLLTYHRFPCRGRQGNDFPIIF